jgi:hypothetical protein
MDCAKQTLKVIENGIAAVCRHFSQSTDDDTLMTDIILQANSETGALRITDDDDNEIFQDTVDEWIGNESEDFYDGVEALLRHQIRLHADELDNLSVIKPYSFILVDGDKETVSELYVADDDTIVFDSSVLMQNLDKDLDDFFDALMDDND